MYNGLTDLESHIRYFGRLALATDMTDAMMCGLFPSTLEDATTDFYEELLPRSISSFDMMAEKFVNNSPLRRRGRRKWTHSRILCKRKDKG